MHTFFFGLILALAMPYSLADCGTMGKAIAETLHPGISPDESLMACKALPGDAGRTILVLPYEAKCPDDFHSHCRDVDIVIVAADGATIVSRLFQKNAWWDDAFEFREATIDTGRYQLSPQDRAFGVNVQRFSRGGSQEDLSLYVMHGQDIEPVLDYLDTDSQTEAGMRGARACNLLNVTTRRTLVIEPATSKGYANLRVNESVRRVEALRKGGRCSVRNTLKKRHVTLHFDGQKYAAPDGSRL